MVTIRRCRLALVASAGDPGRMDPSSARRRPAAVVTPCPDGPLLVRGDVEIVGVDGVPVPMRRRTVALCRCGLSALKPFCDGSHKVAGFRTDA
jgi:Iron-binding zinc finger CDGSH type